MLPLHKALVTFWIQFVASWNVCWSDSEIVKVRVKTAFTLFWLSISTPWPRVAKKRDNHGKYINVGPLPVQPRRGKLGDLGMLGLSFNFEYCWIIQFRYFMDQYNQTYSESKVHGLGEATKNSALWTHIETTHREWFLCRIWMLCHLQGGDGEIVLPIGIVDRRQVDWQKKASDDNGCEI